MSREMINEADRRLFALGNKLSLLEYNRDLGADLGRQVDAVHEAIRECLRKPSLLVAARACSESSLPMAAGTSGEALEIAAGPETARKAALLQQAITFTSIEKRGDVRSAAEAIHSRMENLHQSYSDATRTLAAAPERSARRDSLAELVRAGATMEPLCREWSNTANRAARDAGYPSYADAKLAHEEHSLTELRTLFRRWRDAHLPRWKRILDAATTELGGDVEACDLIYLLRQRTGRLDEVFDTGKMPAALDSLLTALGVSLDNLPISIEFGDIPSSGACYRVAPGRDVRILLSRSLTGFRRYFFWLHEFGHALYYCHCPADSELLIDPHPAREIMADLWTRFLRQKSFLTEIMGLPPRQAGEVIRILDEYETLRLFLYMREALFTLEVLRDPAAPLSRTWREVTTEWLGLDDDSGAFEFFDFLHPLDLKNYVFAQVLSDSAFASLTTGCAEAPLSHSLVEEMVTKFYRPGNIVPWPVKFGIR